MGFVKPSVILTALTVLRGTISSNDNLRVKISLEMKYFDGFFVTFLAKNGSIMELGENFDFLFFAQFN